MNVPSRDTLASQYLEQLPFEPYPVQEEALLTWFTSDQGVLVCAPTGTGKTLIAEAAIFEALHTGQRIYYTTPLIALTDQKLQEIQQSAVRWGFSADDVGLVTGNRRVNPEAKVLVVVAEILLNRLLHHEAFDFSDVCAVVMDEFHSFNDPERGIVWEFSLGLLPAHVRLMLLSATIGNSRVFVNWLNRSHQRKIELVESSDRKVELTYRWVGDQLLQDHLEEMAVGDETSQLTPALVFCFNREECWTVAEQLKGKKLIGAAQQSRLAKELEPYDWSQGAGPKLKPLLMRGVGVHHAGLLPKYRRIVEELFQRKLLSVAICTETLSAGINLPARSVVLPTLLKGPRGDKKLLDPSSAHQMFGRAGRPQFDTRGFVFALAHEDDVKLVRWREKFDQIPENTKDPGLLRARKMLEKKKPKRRTTEQYWDEGQFEKLRLASPRKLASRGPVPWRLLAHMLDASPDVELLRQLVAKRLLEPRALEAGQKQLNRMLLTLWRAGYVELEPSPPRREGLSKSASPAAESAAASPHAPDSRAEDEATRDAAPAATSLFGTVLSGAASGSKSPDPGSTGGTDTKRKQGHSSAGVSSAPPTSTASGAMDYETLLADYQPQRAHPTDRLPLLSRLRGINPLYGVFVINHLGIADRAERIQAMESVLELPRSLGPSIRVPRYDELPAGPLATTRLDSQLLQLGLATAEQLGAPVEYSEEEERRWRMFPEERPRILYLADKLRLLFDYDFPEIHDVRTQAVWVAGELLEWGGDFNKYVTSKQLQKQEGILFRHLLRMVLLCAEFKQIVPADLSREEWETEMDDIAQRLASTCRQVDPTSTDKALEEVEALSEL
jgi:superfamily II DNA/RNA helicase